MLVLDPQLCQRRTNRDELRRDGPVGGFDLRDVKRLHIIK